MGEEEDEATAVARARAAAAALRSSKPESGAASTGRCMHGHAVILYACPSAAYTGIASRDGTYVFWKALQRALTATCRAPAPPAAGGDTLAAALAELDMDHYDDEDEGGLAGLMGGKGNPGAHGGRRTRLCCRCAECVGEEAVAVWGRQGSSRAAAAAAAAVAARGAAGATPVQLHRALGAS